MIAIIDSGIANLRSVEKGFEKVGVAARVVKEPRLLRDAAGIVLPGVGAFADGIATLKVAGFIEPLMREIESGKAILGICLGLHFLFSESEEFGLHKGLDILRGRVRRFPESVPSPVSGDGTLRLKIPHMGWNQVHLQREVRVAQMPTDFGPGVAIFQQISILARFFGPPHVGYYLCAGQIAL